MIESILRKILRYEDIGRTGDNALYMRRFFLWGGSRGAGRQGWRLLLHKFHRGDEDLSMHDHPWPFVSLILTGGYWEETAIEKIPHESRNASAYVFMVEGQWRARIWYGPGSLLIRDAEHVHRVILDHGQPAWTLVWTGKIKRHWGFHTPNGWCHWKKHVAGMCVCGDEGEK